jgi:hypothetical protein
MRSASWWIEWPIGLMRIGVAFLVATTVVAVVVAYPRVLDQFGDRAARNSALSYSDREIAGGNGLVVDQQAVYAARGLIPEDETYHVAVGEEYEGGSDLTPTYVGSYYRYFLLPRRPEDGASWIICYGCDPSGSGSDPKLLWEDGQGISIYRVER